MYKYRLIILHQPADPWFDNCKQKIPILSILSSLLLRHKQKTNKQPNNLNGGKIDGQKYLTRTRR